MSSWPLLGMIWACGELGGAARGWVGEVLTIVKFEGGKRGSMRWMRWT